MENKKVEVILFDLGNVLIDFDHKISAARISKFTNLTPDTIYNLFFDSQLTGDFEEGKVNPMDFYNQVKEKLDLDLDYDSFVPIWNEIFFLSEKNRTVNYITNLLKNEYRLAVLSNINALHYDYIKNNFSVFENFNNVLTSFEMKFRKPDPEIYKKALDVLGVSPDKVFYTDDRPELVEKARELGINAFVFTGIDKLSQDLKEVGININPTELK